MNGGWGQPDSHPLSYRSSKRDLPPGHRGGPISLPRSDSISTDALGPRRFTQKPASASWSPIRGDPWCATLDRMESLWNDNDMETRRLSGNLKHHEPCFIVRDSWVEWTKRAGSLSNSIAIPMCSLGPTAQEKHQSSKLSIAPWQIIRAVNTTKFSSAKVSIHSLAFKRQFHYSYTKSEPRSEHRGGAVEAVPIKDHLLLQNKASRNDATRWKMTPDPTGAIVPAPRAWQHIYLPTSRTLYR